MQQLFCTSPGTLEWREIDAPRLGGDHEALVRPVAVARCEIDPFLTSGLFPSSEPFAVGHEAVVEIARLGDSVRGLQIGQLAVVAFQLSCGHCGACGMGHSGICEEYPTLSDYGMRPLSGIEYGGMLADLVHVPHAQAMLRPVPEGLDPIALASVSDNVADGYRTVAEPLAERPGSEVLVVSHGARSTALYAVQAAYALGASRVDFASDDDSLIAHAARLGACPIPTDFERRAERYPIVSDCGLRAEGLRYSLASTQPEGICYSASYLPQPETALPLGRLYTLGIRFRIGRVHSASLLPEVLRLVAERRIRPEEVTTRVVDWEQAPEAWLEDAVKLVVSRT